MTDAAIADAFRAACEAELQALKPGNVHIHAAGHGMTVEDFRLSAAAAAGPLCRPGTPLGVRLHAAVAATRAAVGQNTNLGILLLCAPLAMAAEQGGTLRPALGRVLAAAGVAEAEDVFRAIVLAAPGGLGAAPRHDVRAPASVPLAAAMAEAAGRDAVARQYAENFADLFALGLPAYEGAQARGRAPAWAVTETYLAWLAALPDSHLARRHGPAAAAAVQAEAGRWLERLRAAAAPQALAPALLAWDGRLKRQGLNPGTSADLTVATLFAHALQGLPRQREDG